MCLWQFTHKIQLLRVATESDRLGHGSVTMKGSTSVFVASGSLGSHDTSLENKNSKKHEQRQFQESSPSHICSGTYRPLSLRCDRSVTHGHAGSVSLPCLPLSEPLLPEADGFGPLVSSHAPHGVSAVTLLGEDLLSNRK